LIGRSVNLAHELGRPAILRPATESWPRPRTIRRPPWDQNRASRESAWVPTPIGNATRMIPPEQRRAPIRQSSLRPRPFSAAPGN